MVRDRRVVLVGGQAVSVWIGQLEDRLGDRLPTAPVVSRDIDFLGNTTDLQRAGNLLGGRVHVAGWQRRTPLAGAALFLDSDGHKRRLDFLESVYGMNSEDIRTTAIEIDLLPGEDRHVPVWVMHPSAAWRAASTTASSPTSRPISHGASSKHPSPAPEPSVAYC